MNELTKQVKFFLSRLSSKPSIGGLQITDSALYCIFIGKELKTFALKVPPGVVKEGKIQNVEQFSGLLRELHRLIAPDRPRLKIPIIASLPAAIVYSQSFNVPNLGPEKIKESADLNLQMISPIPRETAYGSWQKLGESKEVYELLGAFSEKTVVDQYQKIFESAHFAPLAFEFPGLSLARLIGQFMSAVDYSILVFQISGDGLDLFVLRNGNLYFDYFRSWRSIQGESREISKAIFYGVVNQEVTRVLNFTQSKFKENINQVLLVAPGFEVEIQSFLEQQFNLRVMPLQFRSWPVQPTWYVALGSALRGTVDRGQDAAISLAPLSALELYYEGQLMSFVAMWRNIFVGTLLIFLFFYAGSDYFLVRQRQTIQDRVGSFRITNQEKELADLRGKAVEFNRLVNAFSSVGNAAPVWYEIFDKLKGISDSSRIILKEIGVPSLAGQITVIAQAPDYSSVVNFKNSLVAVKTFRNVDLIVPRIVNLENGAVLFTVAFSYNPEAAAK